MLKNKVAVIIPTQNKDGVTFDNTINVKQAMIKLSSLFGGCSSIAQNGAWIDDNGNLHTEENTLVYAFAEELNSENLYTLVEYAKHICLELNQWCISLEINNCMMFIDTTTNINEIIGGLAL